MSSNVTETLLPGGLPFGRETGQQGSNISTANPVMKQARPRKCVLHTSPVITAQRRRPSQEPAAPAAPGRHHETRRAVGAPTSGSALAQSPGRPTGMWGGLFRPALPLAHPLWPMRQLTIRTQIPTCSAFTHTLPNSVIHGVLFPPVRD